MAMVVTDHKAAIVEPGMTRIVVRDVAVLVAPVDLVDHHFEVGPIHLTVTVQIVSSDDDDRGVNRAE